MIKCCNLLFCTHFFEIFFHLERQQCALQQQLLSSLEANNNPLQQLALAQQQVQANVMANAMLQQQQNAANNAAAVMIQAQLHQEVLLKNLLEGVTKNTALAPLQQQLLHDVRNKRNQTLLSNLSFLF